jgi:hypothetical protein
MTEPTLSLGTVGPARSGAYLDVLRRQGRRTRRAGRRAEGMAGRTVDRRAGGTPRPDRPHCRHVADRELVNQTISYQTTSAGFTCAELTKDGPTGDRKIHVGRIHRFKGHEYQKLAIIGRARESYHAPRSNAAGHAVGPGSAVNEHGIVQVLEGDSPPMAPGPSRADYRSAGASARQARRRPLTAPTRWAGTASTASTPAVSAASRAAATASNSARAAVRSSTISRAMTAGESRLARSSRDSSRNQVMSRLTLSRAIRSS